MSPVESGHWTRRSRFSQASSLAGTTVCLTERRPGVIGTASGLVGHRFETGNGNATSWGAGAEASDIEKPGGTRQDSFSLQVQSGFGGTMS